MKTESGFKRKSLMSLIVTCLIFVVACSPIMSNTNVKTPLDAAKVAYDASCGWYIGVYNDVVLLNRNTYLDSKATKVLRNELNPSLDEYKHVLISYGGLLKSLDDGDMLSFADESSIELKRAELTMLRHSIINLLLTIEQLRIEGE